MVAVPLVAITLWMFVLTTAMVSARDAQRVRARTLEVTGELQEISHNLVAAQSAMRGYLVVRDDTWLAPLSAERERLTGRLDRVATLVADHPAEAESASRLRQELAEWFAAAELATRTPAADARLVAERLRHSNATAARINRTLAEMQQRETSLLAVRTAALNRVTLRLSIAALLSLVAGLVGAFTASALYSRGVVRRIAALERNAGRLLTAEPFEPVPGKDEVGRLARQFEDAGMLLRERTSELEAFTYSVSHDLRAPLRHVTGFIDLLREHAGGTLDDESRRYLTTITASAERMGQLIDDLLVLSRVGRAEIQRARVSLPKLLEPVIGEQRAAASTRELTIRVGELPDVMGDPSLIRLAFSNLVANSVKYTRPRAAAEIEIGARTGPTGQVEVFVKDNGVGFDMQYVDRLFGVFQRLHRLDEFEGTGIGLAIVKRVALRHGGRAWAEGGVDRGATFFLSLPRADAIIA